MNKLFILLGVIALVALVALAYSTTKTAPTPSDEIASFDECVSAGYPTMESYPAQCKTPDGETFTQDIGNEMEMMHSIRINSPRPHATIKSPVLISGEAVGGWYFEASFPVKLLDAEGNILAEGPAQAQSDWMTSAFVPFEATLSFASPKSKTGTLVLQKDNPSGLPEHNAELRVPVRFDENSETMSVKVFWGNARGNEPTQDCSAVEGVTRYIPKTEGVANAALMELIKGPTRQEQAQGYISSIPQDSEITIQNLRIENAVAYVDFNAALERGVAGSCRVAHIRAQIESTLKQFPTVKDVVISIDGRTDDILQP